jgi:anaphase-promoting complex subunit 1
MSSFLALRHNSETSLRTLGKEEIKPAASDKWEAVQLREACPRWMHNPAWQWLLDGPPSAPNSTNTETGAPPNFISFHIALAKKWMASTSGLSAFGFEGYLPTALNRTGEPRNMAAWRMLLALHLLVEEDKLSISSSAGFSSSQTDLKAVLHQLTRWLGWRRYEALYGLDAQVASASAQDFGTNPRCPLVMCPLVLRYG